MFEAAVSGARTDEIEDVEVVIRPALTASRLAVWRMICPEGHPAPHGSP
jgi:hypothetical protein